jgi:N-hydroxyarylamine O-acetyltransferase
MSILVTLGNKWILDFGYGDLLIIPIKIESECISKDWFKYYRIDAIEEDNFLLSESKEGRNFTKRYQFCAEPRKIGDFEQQCQFNQESADSYFVKT